MKIEFVSDVSCPWCVIGYQAVQRALERLDPRIQAHICFMPFELNPNMKPEGQDLIEHLQEKYGAAPADLRKTQDLITERGRALGFSFKFREGGRIYNTFDAHRLLYWANQMGKQVPLKLAFFMLYFTEGGNPSSHSDLLLAVEKSGLPVEMAKQVLETGQYAKEVREEEWRILDLGINLVPTIILDGLYKISGSQTVETYVELLERAKGADKAGSKS